MVTGRETLACRFISPLDGKSGLSYVAFSIEDENFKNDGKHVRAEVILSGMVLEEVPEGSKVTFYEYVDPKGNIPAMLFNSRIIERGLVLDKINEYLKT